MQLFGNVFVVRNPIFDILQIFIAELATIFSVIFM